VGFWKDAARDVGYMLIALPCVFSDGNNPDGIEDR